MPSKRKKKKSWCQCSSAFVLYKNHSAYILVSAAFQRFSPRFSRNSTFWENAAVKSFREPYFCGSFWFRKVWCWLSSQWDRQTTNEVYNHEKCRLSRKIWDVSKAATDAEPHRANALEMQHIQPCHINCWVHMGWITHLILQMKVKHPAS